MNRRRNNEAGESLIEIVMAIVLTGIIFTGFFTVVITGSNSSREHRDMVTADGVLRDYAEALKQAVRDTCTVANGGVANYSASYTAPAGYTGVSAVGAAGPTGAPGAAGALVCPQSNTVNRVDITAPTPVGLTKTLRIEVRTP